MKGHTQVKVSPYRVSVYFTEEEAIQVCKDIRKWLSGSVYTMDDSVLVEKCPPSLIELSKTLAGVLNKTTEAPPRPLREVDNERRSRWERDRAAYEARRVREIAAYDVDAYDVEIARALMEERRTFGSPTGVD